MSRRRVTRSKFANRVDSDVQCHKSALRLALCDCIRWFTDQYFICVSHFTSAVHPFKVQCLLCCITSLTFNNSTFCPHSVFMCFVWISEQTAIISVYNINWLVCITETECVYCALRTGSLYTASLTFSNSTFCPHSVFMCFVWIWEQTAIISLYNINWLVFVTETECVYCAVRTGYLNLILANLRR